MNTVAVEPAEVTLYGGGQQTFSPLINGAPAKKNDVTWSISPVVGSINPTGNYRAPSVIDQPMEVTVVATSKANPTKSGTAKVSLLPPPTPVAPTVMVAISPSSGELNPAQTLALSATVDGVSDQRVTWKLDPTVGSLAVSGNQAVYTAPAEIAQQQTVTVEATSVYDSTKSAKALLTLIPAIAITVQPASVELTEGQSYQFSAQVTGTTNQGVTWSLDQAVGTISSGGLYSAPASVGSPTAVKVIAKSNADGTKTSSATANVNPASKVQFTINEFRLTSLSYNGQSYYAYANELFRGGTFRAPDGTETNLGWIGPTSRKKGSNPEYFEHVYNGGQPRQFTIKVVWTTPDARTLRAEVYVTNNDPKETLARFNLYFLPFTTPAPAREYNNNIPMSVDQYAGRPAHMLSGDWGSAAFWQEGYPTNARLFSYYGSADQTEFRVTLHNATRIGPVDVAEESITPGQTKRFVYNLRFGGPTETVTTLAPEAFTEIRESLPYLVNWPDRRPIGNWFLAEGSTRSASNPRGYLWDRNLNVNDLTTFRRLMLEKTDGVIANMNRMIVRPQGVILWDLEGQEFDHAFTYVGYPNKLLDLAPEMDAVADEVFAKLRNAGYHVGITIRPQTFGSGPDLPTQCRHDATYGLRDFFVKTTAAFPYRSFRCSAPDTWEVTSKGPGTQTSVPTVAENLEILRTKIKYAHQRWGVRLFYIDSSVYSGGSPLIHTIFRTLAQEFPDSLLIPEIENDPYWGSTAPYNQANMNVFSTSPARRMVYPEAFSVINVASADLETNRQTLVDGVRRGDILLFRAWINAAEIPVVESIYEEASKP